MNSIEYSTPGVYNPPETKFTVFMEIPPNAPKKLGALIGPEGKIFKAITHQSGVKYIWCNGKNIEICGDNMDYIQDAIRRIHDRCNYLAERKRERESAGVTACSFICRVHESERESAGVSENGDDGFLVHTEHCLRGTESPRGVPSCPACESDRI